MGWPSMYLRVPDAAGFVFAQAFQCVGLGLANAIGAALARPDRLTVAAVGDGGMLLALGELETLGAARAADARRGLQRRRLRRRGPPLPSHGPGRRHRPIPRYRLRRARRAAGCSGVTVRAEADLGAVRDWLAARDGPLVVDAKVDPDICAEWLEEAFRAH